MLALHEPINIDSYDKLHFWFKGVERGRNLLATFDAADGASHEIVCSLGEYKPE